jgi:hypothetical protein
MTARQSEAARTFAELVRCGLVTADEIDKRARDALTGYIGAPGTVSRNIKDAVTLAHEVQAERSRKSVPG